MRFSILAKILTILGGTLFIGVFILTIYIYDSQVNIINAIQLNQKEYISNQLTRSENNAIEQENKNIKHVSELLIGSLSNALYTLNTQSAQDTIKMIYKEGNIKAIVVYDNLSQKNFFVQNKEEEYKKFPSIKNDLTFEGETIGTFEIYYDNSYILDQIAKLKEKDLNDFELETQRISDILQNQVKQQIFWFVTSSILLMLTLAFSLIKFVNTPLQKFKIGLESFFKFLEDSKNSVKEIDINSNDEFGEMSLSTNRSINVSMKLHSEINNLMSVMDKNVIASKTDKHGKITYVSDAFCEVSGYSREEMIGKPHNISRHPDMPKEAFKDLWQTIKKGEIWKGEVKNLKKDGGYYWVDAIVFPLFNAQNEIIGYSSIRHDITSQKEVEELSANQAIQMAEIERSNRLLNGREVKMVELKNQINEYRIQLGQEAIYSVGDTIEAIEEQEIIVNEDESQEDIMNLLDGKELQILMENFYKIMKIPLAIIDLKGNILVQSKWQRACTDFHRVNTESCKRCIESDIDMASKLDGGQKFTSYKCSNGLIDCGSPIIINGKYVANFFIGQFLVNEPDMEYFRNQAKLFGYDEEDYLESIKELPVIKEEMLPNILGFLTGITNIVTSISIEKIEAQKYNKIAKNHEIEMKKGQIAALNLAEDAEKARVEIENYKEHLEDLVKARTEELEEANDELVAQQEAIASQKQYLETVFDSQPNIVITTDGKELKSVNKAFLDFFNYDSMLSFKEKYNCICDLFEEVEGKEYLQKEMDGTTWIEYIVTHSQKVHKATFCGSVMRVQGTSTQLGNETFYIAVFTDVTEIEAAQEKILESQSQLQLAYEAGNLGLWDWRPATDAFYTNDIWYTMLGYEPGIYPDTVEKWLKVAHPDDVDKTFEALQNHMDGKTPMYHCQQRLKNANGEWIWINDVGRVVEWDADGKPSRLLGVQMDINETKKLADEIEKQKEETEKILANILLPVLITSKEKRKILYANKYAEIQYEKSVDEIVGSNIDDIYTIQGQHYHIIEAIEKFGKIENMEETFKTASGKEFTALLSVTPITYQNEDAYIGMVTDITKQKEIEEEIRTQQIQMRTLVDAIPSVIFMKDKEGKHLLVNKFYTQATGVTSEQIIGKTDFDVMPLEVAQSICDKDKVVLASKESLTYEESVPHANGEIRHYITSKIPLLDTNGSIDGMVGIATDITASKELQKQIEEIHKHTRESIEYASLIQHALIPSNDLFRKYFSDYLTIWHPKDIVGGDIYLFEELRNDNECLLMVIDCTGHGVPGAFVTMLVKAIERQITSFIINSDEVVSPAKILSIFNRSMKHLLKQESADSISNAGFDGGIIYYNKKEKIVKFAGAEVALFYIQEGELKTIKGSRQSVGYKKSDANFEFKEHVIEVKEGMQFYLTTDGYLDQNGGEKGFPFGKKRFSEILINNQNLPFADQQEALLYDMQDYQGNEERNDDVTVVGIKI